MLPDQSEFHYQMKFRREQILRDLEQRQLRRIALEAHRQKTPHHSFNPFSWLKRALSNGATTSHEIVPAQRPAEGGVH